ncbi:hypothetical protein DHEL01_v213061 [Diaporthe helianthi]|uniref:Uncharacterized protein n=1 Tax=Diaporthe helianthi TaxID=158607 RepID=A0A2P5HE56_DIAHE|nr:hypothetical protein DHEL01_v213061 [Diaporthe helianthi]
MLTHEGHDAVRRHGDGSDFRSGGSYNDTDSLARVILATSITHCATPKSSWFPDMAVRSADVSKAQGSRAGCRG